jgi:hypothetical protein
MRHEHEDDVNEYLDEAVLPGKDESAEDEGSIEELGQFRKSGWCVYFIDCKIKEREGCKGKKCYNHSSAKKR